MTPAPVTRSLSLGFVLLLVAALCLGIALLIATGIVHGGNQETWEVGGLFAYVLSVLLP